MTTTYLPLPPEFVCIELEIESIEMIDQPFECGGYDEFQMLAENRAIRERQKAAQHRELRRDLQTS